MEETKIVPEELKTLWLKKEAADNLKESYVRRPLGFKKALKCAELSRKLTDEFWKSIRALYPEFELNMLQLDWQTWTVSIYKKEA